MVDATPSWVAIAVLAALPLLLAAATAFAKSSVLIAAVRVGLGAEALLPMPIVLALGIVLTAVVMLPVGEAISAAISEAGGIEAAIASGPGGWLTLLEPWRAFLERHADPAELEQFAAMTGRASGDPAVVVPAFLVTELGEALAMAVVVLVPLVVVDLLVAQALTLLGFTQLPGQLVAVPLKLLLFLAVGGWDVIVRGLIEGYG